MYNWLNIYTRERNSLWFTKAMVEWSHHYVAKCYLTFTELNEDGLHSTDEMQPINIVMLIFIWLSEGTDKQQINNWRTKIRAPSLLQTENKNPTGHKSLNYLIAVATEFWWCIYYFCFLLFYLLFHQNYSSCTS